MMLTTPFSRLYKLDNEHGVHEHFCDFTYTVHDFVSLFVTVSFWKIWQGEQYCARLVSYQIIGALTEMSSG